MPEFIRVASVNDVTEGRGHLVEVNGKRIGVYRLGDEYHAIDDHCPHADASLCDGDISDGEVACPLHFATFEIRTGRCTAPPADDDLATYQVLVKGDDIELAL